MKCAELKLPATPKALRVINDQLWCCCNKTGIVVFNAELQQQRVIQDINKDEVHDVAKMNNGDLVIATIADLYHTDDTGNTFNL